MSPTKILFLCSSRLAVPALQELAFLDMVAVVVIPAHCEEMIEMVQYVLKGKRVPVQVVNRTSYVEQISGIIKSYHIEVGLIITFSYLIPVSLYTLVKNGFYNVHPGPLPSYRGADPVFQQIKNREMHTGLTIHKLSPGFDTGPVVMMEMIPLLPTDTHGMLTTRLSLVAARLSMLLLRLITLNIPVPSTDQDESKARYFKRQKANDVSINWKVMSGDAIIALINACNPWNKGATTKLNNRIVRLLEAEKIGLQTSDGATAPGVVISIKDTGLVVSTIRNECIRVRMIYTDEGFFIASRLSELGVVPGNTFESI